MAFVIDHTREIAAPPALVWQALTDFDSYPSWNPFAVEATCDLRPGGAIVMRVALRPPKVMTQKEFIVSVDEGRGFAYAMKPAPAGLLRSIREQSIVDLGDGRSRYTSHFQLDGPLSPVVGAILGGNLRRGFEGNADGLVARAEFLAR
ncbi:SRPBCC domain-containing protein [Tsukamurella spumae]|uniref:SRPBCC domain-containing protein n=1 Tax=Tsukamurella spumae TaxID=44753 RepID=A0A846X152_9ACTN|nr:SRPBCC domain-containing protein [Tsukamurella spumae]NKY18225.1 SRPBCC domain-containing protein [Tsukamurella spumae]